MNRLVPFAFLATLVVATSAVTAEAPAKPKYRSAGEIIDAAPESDWRTPDPDNLLYMAVADGVVSYSGVRSGYGNVVEVDHGNGYTTLYGHNSRLIVRAGDIVRAGQQLAKAGSTGRSTGPHVHFEVHVNGRPVNPRKFLDKVHG